MAENHEITNAKASIIVSSTAPVEENFEIDDSPEESDDFVYDSSQENVEKVKKQDKEKPLYTQKELKDCVLSVAGSFYGNYIQKFHYTKITSEVEELAAKNIVSFCKRLLITIKKES